MKFDELRDEVGTPNQELALLFAALLSNDVEQIDGYLGGQLREARDEIGLAGYESYILGYLVGVRAMAEFVLRTQPKLVSYVDRSIMEALDRNAKSAVGARAKKLRFEQRKMIVHARAIEFLETEIDRFRNARSSPPSTPPSLKTIARRVFAILVDELGKDPLSEKLSLVRKVIQDEEDGTQYELSITRSTIERNYLSGSWTRKTWATLLNKPSRKS